jgi:hypothetical protein
MVVMTKRTSLNSMFVVPPRRWARFRDVSCCVAWLPIRSCCFVDPAGHARADGTIAAPIIPFADAVKVGAPGRFTESRHSGANSPVS